MLSTRTRFLAFGLLNHLASPTQKSLALFLCGHEGAGFVESHDSSSWMPSRFSSSVMRVMTHCFSVRALVSKRSTPACV